MMSDSPNQDMNPMTEGPVPANFPGGGPVPEGAECAKPYPGGMMMIEPPKVKGWPYVRRSFKLLGNHKLIVTATLLLTLAMNLAPFVVAAAFVPQASAPSGFTENLNYWTDGRGDHERSEIHCQG